MKQLFSLIVMLMMVLRVSAAEQFVIFQPSGDALSLQDASISYNVREHPCVHRAIASLQGDFQKVTGRMLNGSAQRIVIGTVGVNSQIDQWVKKGELKDLKGKNEKYIIKTIGDQLVIAGSDKRGTVFGIYELSKQIGVSPWYYWADVPVMHHDTLYIIKGEYTDGEPAVKYRGIFLNDEAPCLTSWVKNTFGTGYGDHRFYEKVFELILRLKGNFLWPAMWSWAFYADDPENSKVADEMGVIIGTSHHEPMARNHQEYARKRGEWGPWNYQKNKDNLDRFFREGIERMKGTDDIVTIGMRGDGDAPMGGKEGHDDEFERQVDKNKKLMERIFNNQRKIIAQETGKPASQRQQVWALYKEVQDFYDAGLKVPDDVIILVSDDNWGNIRRVPDTQHKGGWGIYYHVDYVGAPRNSKWLNVTQTQQMFEQLSLAYDFGIDKLWILNVGDLKPMEYPIQLFCDMAYRPKSYNLQNVTDHTENFFEKVVGKDLSKEAARIYNRNCQYMARVTPEMLDVNTYNVQTGEFKQVTDEYLRLETEALRLYLQLPEKCKDAYYQLVLFPVQAMANLYDMYYAQAMNLYCANNNNPDANYWADKVSECFKRDSLLCTQYNNDLANGKWHNMMIQKHIGYKSWNDNFPHEMLPETKRINQSTDGGFVFEPSNGYVSMEAEHFYEAKSDGDVKWEVYPYYGRTRSAVALTPYTKPVGNSSLTYRFKLPEGYADSIKVHVIVKSTLDFQNRGGHEYTVSVDGQVVKTVNFNHDLLDKQPYAYTSFYPTVARRVVEKIVGFKVDKSNYHTLTITPKHPGIVFEKFVIDFGGYKGEYLFGKESEVKKN